MIQNKVRWNSFGLFMWAMCMAFSWDALCCHIKIWYQCVFGRCGMAVHFTQFARWKGHFQNKPFLVCHSHTPTQSVAPHWAPSDNVAAIVLFCIELCVIPLLIFFSIFYLFFIFLFWFFFLYTYIIINSLYLFIFFFSYHRIKEWTFWTTAVGMKREMWICQESNKRLVFFRFLYILF